MSKCLFCYQDLQKEEKDFYLDYSKKMFGLSLPPILPYTRKDLSELAKKIIRSQTTITGVQPKLSLDLNNREKNTPKRFTIVGLWGKYIVNSIFCKLEKSRSKWQAFLEMSFLSKELKTKYSRLIIRRWKLLE